ncbi:MULTISPECIES: DUF2975 domain-containing protein [Chryseobacterium]|uniref:DUF2975 domain-containing protein n=1 Tax=Chryseobacterium camelliae TaxID=1265445 RepID=A0ABU0TIG5_9FLAO|nr:MULTISPECIES: DUF2975 domain-containing protein [Chryseobacterium]MDT3409288.1 hypothetical protein [Pseudacidovorax intermedius]MDQ1096848.1 hypothetical protein [Chryseobacterium camelliae]MDQ1100790.1 hypothetical protein [Chryseobacterium sp. SORGH_AS_1048]MDR6084233.1 hypothetical protein [Chryseobacterium sp. SORGH_AS_0909]MDR6132505.1 hypothetical protein [Chryseobacterium sp. SORGH_AS_1175]
MNQTKIISRILYYLCMLLSAGYVLTFLYSAVCLLTGFSVNSYDHSRYLRINDPFSRYVSLTVENNPAYILFSFLAVLLAYGIFFGLSAGVFRVFFGQKLFTEKNIAVLKKFYLYNIFFPLPAALVAARFVEVEHVIWGLVFIHFMLGIFCLFLANIFSQGLHLQNEQDLFI